MHCAVAEAEVVCAGADVEVLLFTVVNVRRRTSCWRDRALGDEDGGIGFFASEQKCDLITGAPVGKTFSLFNDLALLLTDGVWVGA